MQARATPEVARAALLCLIAGYVDAIGYIDYAHVFAANMTGNTVLLAISLAERQWPRALTYAMTLAAFLVGALLAEIAKRRGVRPAIPLLVSAVPLVALTTVKLDGSAALALLAFGMGMQGGSVARFHDINAQTVVITGTILKLAEALVFRLAPGRGDPRTPPPPAALPVFGLSWLGYGVGAVLSVAAAQQLGQLKLLLPLIVLIPVAIAEYRER